MGPNFACFTYFDEDACFTYFDEDACWQYRFLLVLFHMSQKLDTVPVSLISDTLMTMYVLCDTTVTHHIFILFGAQLFHTSHPQDGLCRRRQRSSSHTHTHTRANAPSPAQLKSPTPDGPLN